MTSCLFHLKTLGISALLAGTAALSAQAQTIITTSNGIIRNSLCVGGDCQSGIPFSDSTIIVKENNTRIKFADTSTINNFPRNDWELEANSQTNGGPNRFTLWDCGENSNDGGCSAPENVLSVEAGAGNNAVFVDDGGRVGFGTGTPVVELHVRDGDTPTLRLEQDSSNGFDPQTFDVAANETNFFIRDVTNGSTLPFRIQPGAASNVVYIASDEQVGLGTTSPDAPLEVRATAANIGSGNAALKLVNTGGDVAFQLDADDDGSFWNITHIGSNDELRFSKNGNATGVELTLAENGNLTITGTLTTAGANYPDYVFAPDYELMPLHEVGAFIAENGHLPKIPTEAEVMKYGMNISEMQVALLEKVEELTLYTLQQQKTIEAQGAALEVLRRQVAAR